MAVGNSCRHRICRRGSGRRSFTSDLDHRIFPAWRLGPGSRTSGAWSLLDVPAGPAHSSASRIRVLLRSLRLLHGVVFLCATRRVDGGTASSAARSGLTSAVQLDRDIAEAASIHREGEHRRPLRRQAGDKPPDRAVALSVKILVQHYWWAGSESNTRHEDFQSSALPTELPAHRDGKCRALTAVLIRTRPQCPLQQAPKLSERSLGSTPISVIAARRHCS